MSTLGSGYHLRHRNYTDHLLKFSRLHICSEDSVGSLGNNSHFHPSGGSYKSQGVDSRRTVVYEVRRQNEITRSLRSLHMLFLEGSPELQIEDLVSRDSTRSGSWICCISHLGCRDVECSRVVDFVEESINSCRKALRLASSWNGRHQSLNMVQNVRIEAK